MSAPRHLQPNTRQWFAGVTDEYVLEPHHERLLQASRANNDGHILRVLRPQGQVRRIFELTGLDEVLAFSN